MSHDAETSVERASLEVEVEVMRVELLRLRRENDRLRTVVLSFTGEAP